MRTFPSRPWWYVGLTLFGLAFGYLEAGIVVYLRALYYPEGFAFPLVLPEDTFVLTVEVGREAATLFMLLGAALAAGWNGWTRYAAFSLLFGVWDIIYYLVLKWLLDWPESILDFDVLFLIPVPWIAPCLAPILISVGLILSAIVIERLDARGVSFSPNRWEWALAVGGGVIALYTFMRDLPAGLHQAMPMPYPWGLFALGYLLALAAFISACRRALR
ncbi:hypothetical protein HS125_13775 [bacterium]|nr:hypothetical protein [bacterium]